MRKTLLATILFAGALSMLVPAPVLARVSWSVSVSSFHDSLSPYGRWVASSRYGEVWVPSGIAADWQPYWDGEWVWTDYGWTWVSNDPWGDIPCHYGSWDWDDSYGWTWVAGTVWSPAWVTWAWTDGYVGWAPVPPTFALSSGGYSGPPLVAASARYVFVPSRSFVGVNASKLQVPVSQRAVLLRQARKATRFSVSGGIVRTTADPPRSFVERASGRRIERVSVDRIKSRPTPLAAAHVSGKQFRIVSPLHQPSTASARHKARPAAAQAARQARSARSPARANAVAARTARTTKAHPSGSSRVSNASRALRTEQKRTTRAVRPRQMRSDQRRPSTTVAKSRVTSRATAIAPREQGIARREVKPKASVPVRQPQHVASSYSRPATAHTSERARSVAATPPHQVAREEPRVASRSETRTHVSQQAAVRPQAVRPKEQPKAEKERNQ